MSEDLKGKNAVITGSSSGIGLGIAEALAESGVNLLMNGIESDQQVEEERQRIASQFGVMVLYRQADMSVPEEVRGLIEFGKSDLGSVDILVNNAGIQFVSPVEEFPEEKWDAIIAINLSSAFHAIKAVIPAMKRAGWGRIINVSSAHGLVASPFKTAYVAAKHGALGITKTVALEVADQGITVNAICPAYVWTPLVEKQIPDTAASRGISEKEVIEEVLLKAQPTKKFVSVEQIGALACFLCSDAAASITGAALTVDGGWTAQ